MEYYIDRIALNDLRYPWRPQIDAFPAELLDDLCEKKGFSEIHKIVLGFSYKDLDTEVGICPEALDGVDWYGYTPLYYAIQFGNSDHVRVLVSHGVDIPHYLFWTAVESGNCASTQLLLGRGLRPNDLVPRTLTLDLYWPEYKLDGFSWLSLPLLERYINSYGRCISEMDRLLIDYGFDFSAGVTQGITALMACCRWKSARGGIKRMKCLLEHGIDPEIKDHYGQTAIHHALRNNNVPAFETLIKHGACLDARTSKGETALHIAVRWTGKVAMVHALSKAGIMQLGLDVQQCDGKTAFDVLKRRAEGYYWGNHSRTSREKYHLKVHIPIIRAFEALFQEIQEHQGVPLEDRYPALHIAALGKVIAAEQFGDTYSGSSEQGIYEVSEDDHPTNHNSNEPTCAPPGAWPE